MGNFAGSICETTAATSLTPGTAGAAAGVAVATGAEGAGAGAATAGAGAAIVASVIILLSKRYNFRNSVPGKEPEGRNHPKTRATRATRPPRTRQTRGCPISGPVLARCGRREPNPVTSN